MKRILTIIAAILAVAAPAFAQAPDIRGTWDVSFNSAQGARPATMNILTGEGKLAAYINVVQMSQEKPAATMTGTWAFEVTHSAGTSTPTVTITQTDGKLSGKYQSTYGQFDLTGSIKGADFTFSVEVGTEQKVTLVYNGTLNGDAVKGSLTMGEMGEGTFTGKRK